MPQSEMLPSGSSGNEDANLEPSGWTEACKQSSQTCSKLGRTCRERGVVKGTVKSISEHYMVSIGATKSREAISTPVSERMTVRIRAKLGSPFNPVRLKKLRKEMRLSLAIACIKRGAPVRDCSPAPSVENRAPIRITQRDGQDSSDTVRPIASPNWSSRKKR